MTNTFCKIKIENQYYDSTSDSFYFYALKL